MQDAQTEATTQGDRASVDLERLLHDLNRYRKRGAEQIAAALPPDLLMELIRKEASQFARCQRRGILVTPSALAAILVAGGMLPSAGNPVLLAAFGPICLGFAIGLYIYMPNGARSSVRRLIAAKHDPEFIGPALNLVAPDRVAGSVEDAYIVTFNRHPITGALARMLRSVRADHNQLLTKAQMEIMLTLLRNGWTDEDLKCAILKALEQIGDETALPIVESLASDSVHAVCVAAQECLPYLQQRIRQQQQAQVLLRPSDGSGSIADALLRPAAADATSTPDHLLRPHA